MNILKRDVASKHASFIVLFLLSKILNTIHKKINLIEVKHEIYPAIF